MNEPDKHLGSVIIPICVTCFVAFQRHDTLSVPARLLMLVNLSIVGLKGLVSGNFPPYAEMNGGMDDSSRIAD